MSEYRDALTEAFMILDGKTKVFANEDHLLALKNYYESLLHPEDKKLVRGDL